MPNWFESLFEFLFKYRPVVFERADFSWSASWPVVLIGVGGLAIAVPTLLRYSTVAAKSSATDRRVLSGLRIAALTIVFLSLLRPTLVVSTVVPQRSFVGVVFDDSRSMRIADGADEQGKARSQTLSQVFHPETSPVVKALTDKFMVRYFRFSDATGRVGDASELQFSGSRSNLSRALARSVDSLSTVPLAGLVLVSDGADNSTDDISDQLLDLSARKVPVYSVGLGRERFSRDIELTRVEAPRSVLRGSALVVDVTISQRGFDGETARLDVEDDSRIVSTREFALSAESETTTVRVHFTASDAGARQFRFRVAPMDGEMVTQNNERRSLIQVEDRREKILYLEGEPRFELGFIRRAVKQDENLQLVCLQRTAENKFYRLGIDDSDELAAGFPKTREELFEYRGLILGSVEAGFFTHDQLTMIADFVSQRGGGLLTLGGRLSFSEGGFAGTPLEDALPVVLDGSLSRGATEDSNDTEFYFSNLTVSPTPAGRTHPTTQFSEVASESQARWETLPSLSSLNLIRSVKPGATTLLQGLDSANETQPVLVFQRYGRGKSISLTVHDSWLWQMHADVPLEDMSHELLWRKTLRWLVSYVPDRVAVNTDRDRYAPGESVLVRAEVDDETFLKVNDARVRALVKTPSGELGEYDMDWTVDQDGEYRVTFVAEEKGVYEVEVVAERGEEALGTAHTFVQSTELDDEYFGAEMRAGLLERIANETGGRFYTPETVSRMPEDMTYIEGGSTVRERKEIWDMPFLFFTLIGLVGSEWGYRKLRGLA